MGLFDIKPYKPGKKSNRKSIKSKPFKLFEPVKLKSFSLINSKPSKSKYNHTGLFQPVKITPVNSKTKNLIFGFDIPKPARKIKGKKSLSYKQAKVKFPGLAPHGDADRDGVNNWLDCRPFDPRRQGSWKEETKHVKKKSGPSYFKSKEFKKMAKIMTSKQKPGSMTIEPINFEERDEVNKFMDANDSKFEKAWEQRRRQALKEQGIAKETKARNAAKLKTDENPLTPAPYPKTKSINVDDPVQEKITNEAQWVKKEYPKLPKSKYEEEAEEYDPYDDEGFEDARDEPSTPEPKDDARYLEHSKEKGDDEAYEKLSSKDKAKANEGLLDY